MKGLGISCHLEKDRPIVVAVLMEGSRERPSGREAFRHVADAQDAFPQQLRSISDDLASRLPDMDPDVVVIRSMDFFARRAEGVTRKRYMVDGVLTQTAQRLIDRVQCMNGKQVGAQCGLNKKQIESEAASIVGDELSEAGGAALAALVIAGGSD